MHAAALFQFPRSSKTILTRSVREERTESNLDILDGETIEERTETALLIEDMVEEDLRSIA